MSETAGIILFGIGVAFNFFGCLGLIRFPDIYNRLKQSFYRERDRTLTVVEQNILKFGSDEYEFLGPEDQEQGRRALERMGSRYGYCEHCAKDVIAFVLRTR